MASLAGLGRWRRGLATLGLVGTAASVLVSCVSTVGLHVVATPDVATPSGPAPFRADGFRTAFEGVGGTSATDVWAVGGVGWDIYGGWTATPFTAHFDGHRWTAIPVNVSGVFGPLNAVAAASSTDVWATGPDDQVPYPGGHTTDSAALLHYDGHSWQVVNVPRTPTQVVQLSSISAVSPSDIWAVGGSELPGKLFTPLALHYDGTSWKQIPFPASSGELTTVSTAGRDVVYAAGSTEPYTTPATIYVGRWNGTAWQLLPTPGTIGMSTMRAIGAVSASEAWAVGDQRNSNGSSSGARAWHWTSGRWVTTIPYAQTGASLTSVDSHDPHHVWAAGLPGGSVAAGNLLIVTWTTHWTTAFTFPANTTSQPLQAICLLQGHTFSVGGTSQTVAVQN